MRAPAIAASLAIGLIVTTMAAIAPAAAQGTPPTATAPDVAVFVKAAIAFTRGVYLNEARLQAILDNMESLNGVGAGDKGEEVARRALRDGQIDFDVVVKDPDYVAWCAAHGQEPRGFFRDLIRLQTLVMRESVNANAEQMKARMPEQRKQLEQMKSSMGEDAYKKAVAMFEAGMAELDRTLELVKQVPPPNDEEAALMTKYDDQIKAAMGDDETEIERY